jgi:hypothetical protein
MCWCVWSTLEEKPEFVAFLHIKAHARVWKGEVGLYSGFVCYFFGVGGAKPREKELRRGEEKNRRKFRECIYASICRICAKRKPPMQGNPHRRPFEHVATERPKSGNGRGEH